MAFAMAFTMMAGAAYTDQDDIQATDAVELLATLNVMTGKGDGMFHPNDTITRAEICRIIYTIRNEGNDNANAYADMPTTFQDLTSADDWAKGYIKHCKSVNLISGRDEAGTTFGPQDEITGVELAVICLRVLGYDPAKAGIGGTNWDTRTIGLASEAGLLKGVNMESVTGPCQRQWAAQIMANMLDARTVRWSTDGEQYTTYGVDNTPNKKVGKEYMKLHTSVGTLISVSGGNLDIVRSASDIADSDGDQESFTNLDKDYTELLGQKVKVLYYDGKANSVIGVYALDGNTVYTVNASAVESDDNKVKFDGKSYAIEYIETTKNGNGSVSTKRTNDSINVAYVNINGGGQGNQTLYSSDGKTITGYRGDFTSQAGVYYQGDAVSKTSFASNVFDDWNTSSAIMKFVDSDNNGRLDSVIITDYAASEVTSATSTKLVAGKTYNHSDHNIDEGIAQGDWVSISYNRFDDCCDIKKIDSATAKMDGFKKDSKSDDKNNSIDPKIASDRKTGNSIIYNEYRIDSTWYNGASDIANRADLNTVRAGDSVEYIVLNGVMWKVKRASAASLDNVVDVAMVVNKAKTVNGQQVKLQFFNDTTATVEVDNYQAVGARIPYGSLVTGTLYEYSVSGGKYIFETLKDVNDDKKYADFYGDYTYQGQKTYNFGTNGGDTKLDKEIDDKARVILFHGDNETDDIETNEADVITGKQLKALKASQVAATTTATSYSSTADYFTADVSGLNRTAAIAMKVATMPNNTTTNDYYGYILSDANYSQGNGELEYKLLLENGETITVYEKSTAYTSRKANTLIGYKSLTEEDSNGKRYIDEVTLYSIGSDNFGLGAITSVHDKQTSIELRGYGKDTFTPHNTVGLYNYDFDVTTDTVVFYVDTNDKEGTTTGTIREAIEKTSNDQKGTVLTTSTNKKMIANCLYLAKDKDDLEVLVVEATDDQFRGPDADTAANQLGAPALNLDLVKVDDETGTVHFKTTPRNLTGDLSTTTVTVKVKNAAGTDKTTDFTMDPSSVTLKKNDDDVSFTVTPRAVAAAGTYTIEVSVNNDSKTYTNEDVISFTVAGTAVDATDPVNAITFTGDLTSATLEADDTVNIVRELTVSAANPNAQYTVDTASVAVKNNNNVIDTDTPLEVGTLSVSFDLKAKDAYVFAKGTKITATLNGQKPVSCDVSDDGKTLTVTYELPVAAKEQTIAIDLTDSTTIAASAKSIQSKLDSKDKLAVVTGQLGDNFASNVDIAAGTTLKVNDIQTAMPTLNGEGTVEFAANVTDPSVTNAATAKAFVKKIGTEVPAVTDVATKDNSVEKDITLDANKPTLKGTGKVTAFSSTKTLDDLAKNAGSDSVSLVYLELPATFANGNFYGTWTLNDNSTKSMISAGDTPLTETDSGTMVGQDFMLTVGNNVKSLTLKVKASGGADWVTYTFNFK